MIMLTSYLVKCPYPDCNWSGSLLPSRDTEAWRSSVPTASTAEFECPGCMREWHAKVVGDDVVPLPLEVSSFFAGNAAG
jgi:hypothetical protein